MAYDGKVMRAAWQRFEEDKQRRASQAETRRRRIYQEVPRLEEIEKQADKLGIVQDILLEVNIGGEAAKSGFAPEAVAEAASHAKELAHVQVRGLMTIPPASATQAENMVYFQKVHALYVDINQKKYDNKLDYLSMGMSGDFADAIRAGSNMVRVGTAIFGARDYTK